MYDIANTNFLNEIFMFIYFRSLYRLDTHVVHVFPSVVVMNLGSFLCWFVGWCDVGRVKEHVDCILKRLGSVMVSLCFPYSISIF